MLRLIERTVLSLRHSGLKSTLKKIIRYPQRQRTIDLILRGSDNIEERFTEIYKKKAWHFSSDESSSGAGSSFDYTANLRRELPHLVKKYSIKSLFDAPCGDFNWMRHFLQEAEIDYVGGDIVAPLIAANTSKYANQRTRFVHLDLTRDAFPACDLMICRDCLFHLSFRDTGLVLQNFVAAKIPYLLTTTHINRSGFKNRDIVTGDYRLIDLFAPPYTFPSDVLSRIADWKEPDPPREMCLWTRDHIIEVLKMQPWRDVATISKG
jgi:hypothetical protein